MSSGACFPDRSASRVPVTRSVYHSSACTLQRMPVAYAKRMAWPVRARKQHPTMTCVLASAGQTAKQLLCARPSSIAPSTSGPQYVYRIHVQCRPTGAGSRSSASGQCRPRALQAVLAALPPVQTSTIERRNGRHSHSNGCCVVVRIDPAANAD